jgi:hypothetical protein
MFVDLTVSCFANAEILQLRMKSDKSNERQLWMDMGYISHSIS